MNRAPSATVLWLLAGFSLVVVVLLYRLSSGLDDAGFHKVEAATNELAALNIAADLEVLKLRHRQAQDYDSLAGGSRHADELLLQIRPEFERFGLGAALDSATEAWSKKRADIERFKRYNAIVSTAQYHFINLSDSIGRNRDYPLLNAVSRRMLIFLVEGGGEDLPTLINAVQRLETDISAWPEPWHTQGSALVAHGRLILGNLQRTQEISRAIMDSSFPSALADVYGKYRQERQKAAMTADRFRMAMAGFALLLVASVVLALLQLRLSRREIVRSHRLLDNIADNLGEGILAFNTDGRVGFVNRRAVTLIGRQENELLGLPAGEALFAAANAADNRVLAAIAAGERFFGEEWIAVGGKRLPAGFIGGPLPSDSGDSNEPVRAAYVLSFRDLSEVREAQARLHVAAHVFDGLAEAMVIAGCDGLIQFVNPAFTAITGYTEEEVRGKRYTVLFDFDHQHQEFIPAMVMALRDNGQWQGEVANRRKNGESFIEWLTISTVRDAEGHLTQYIGLFSDISERKAAEDSIHRLAYHDPVTGLANRRLLHERLDAALSLAQRINRPLALLLFDLDRFKIVNEGLGHETGDRLLKEVARRITDCIYEGDTLARLGGDEFAWLMPEIRDGSDALRGANKLAQYLAPAVNLDGRDIFVTASIGIAMFPEHGPTGEVLLRNADVALYEAKSGGRNTWRVFDPDSGAHADDRFELEADLRYAVSRQELTLHYQLQFETDTLRVGGAEALVRWRHPERGLLPPDRFIPLAEQTGLIEEIGAWCLESACRQFIRWQAEGIPIPRVAVNVSARQLRAPGFADLVMGVVQKTGMDPKCLELELTESMLSDNTEATFDIFTQLRKKGIRIAIDDFGTGYSSLNYLAEFPVDLLKIDRSFVRRLGNQSEASYVVEAIVVLAKSMNMETIAEGVEEAEQHAQLVKLECDLTQGFLFARPEAPENLPAIMERILESAAH